jgi:integrase
VGTPPIKKETFMKTEEKTEWVTRWRMTVAATRYPGVFRRKEGGYVVEAKVTDPTSGKRTQVLEVLREVKTPTDARDRRHHLIASAKAPKPRASGTLPLFCDYAASLVEEKHTTGVIASKKTLSAYISALERHLLPTFGELRIDEITPSIIKDWKVRFLRQPKPPRAVALKPADQVSSRTRERRAKKAREGDSTPDRGNYSAAAVNFALRLLKSIMASATDEFDLPKDPSAKVDLVVDRGGYTEEEPNALTADEARDFLQAMQARYPQHHAMVALGFVLGQRPSTLRPLRRTGDEADVLWLEGAVRIRRSNAIGQTVMASTKQGTRYRVSLPPAVMGILRDHVAALPEGPQRESALLFPAEHGGFRAATGLRKAIIETARGVGLRKRITPKAMRRTFQDLARQAGVPLLVQKAICGHADRDMTDLYSTVSQGEILQATTKIAALLGMGEKVGEKSSPETRNEESHRAKSRQVA